jgi:NAD(P)-dependent dehydrogenase (short-subunit alcohol dehydrogenase family)
MTARADTALLLDKVAIVTGAATGIGRGIAISLARAGAHVAVCDRHESEVLETAKQVKALGRKALASAFDAADEPAVADFVARVAAQLGAPTILIPNAGIMPVVAIEHMSEADMDACYRAKFKSAVLFSKHCVPHMRVAREGSIVFMASVTGHVGFAQHAVYGAINAALQALARGMAMELAPHGIRVNSVSPGTVDAPMLSRYIADRVAHGGASAQQLRAAFDSNHPRGQIASIDEVANCFVFLASPLAANITATDLRCDGGFSHKGGQADS